MSKVSIIECAIAHSGLASHAARHCTSTGRTASPGSCEKKMEPLARIIPAPTGIPWQTGSAGPAALVCLRHTSERVEPPATPAQNCAR